MSRMQEIFNLCATHLLTQKKKSVTDIGLCVYLSPTGEMCGAAPLLDFEYLQQHKEDIVKNKGTDIEVCLNRLEINEMPYLVPQALKREYVDLTSDELRMVKAVQSVHDNSSVSSWADCLGILARSNELDDSVCLSSPE